MCVRLFIKNRTNSFCKIVRLCVIIIASENLIRLWHCKFRVQLATLYVYMSFMLHICENKIFGEFLISISSTRCCVHSAAVLKITKHLDFALPPECCVVLCDIARHCCSSSTREKYRKSAEKLQSFKQKKQSRAAVLDC